MATSGGVAMKIVLICCCWAIVIQSALADGNDQFLDDINQYRTSLSLPAFTVNSGATCVAQQVAEEYKGTPCSNTSGTATVSGLEPQRLDDALLAKCKLQAVNVKDGYIGPTCVPAGTSAANAPKLAANNITMSPADTLYVNDTKFVSAGVGSVDNAWFVLVLATKDSGGNYVNEDLDPSDNQASALLSAGLGLVSILVASFVSTFLLA